MFKVVDAFDAEAEDFIIDALCNADDLIDTSRRYFRIVEA